MSKIKYFDNFKIIPLDDCIRECVRFYKGNGMTAILQKNGIVAINGSNHFKRQTSYSKYRVALALYGLKLISNVRLQSYKDDYEKDKYKNQVSSLKNEAERLGYKLVKKQ